MDFLSRCFRPKFEPRDEEDKAHPCPWRLFSLTELHAATKNFNYDNKLGEGTFGSVYWGQLWDGSQIAVKRLKMWSIKEEMEFAIEVEVLGRVRHKNLLNLRGYCAEGKERLIVYDFMANSSLASHLHGENAADQELDWRRRMNIAIGSAEAIAYLHHHASLHIIHKDIKASNLLLDMDFQPHVADFGFTKLLHEGLSPVSRCVKGMLGYLAPEYAVLGQVTEKCDVYSFGILLLELMSGCRPVERLKNSGNYTIVERMMPLILQDKIEEMVDPNAKATYVEEEAKRMARVARLCTQIDPEDRPNMIDVVAMLKGEKFLPQPSVAAKSSVSPEPFHQDE